MRHASLFILFLVLSSLLVVTAPVRAEETGYYALSFDGEDDYVVVPAWAEDGQDLTIIAIIRPLEITGTLLWAPVFTSYWGGWGFQISSNTINAKAMVDGVEKAVGLFTGTGFWGNTLFIAETVDYDPATNTTTLKGYLNGEYKGETTATGAPDHLSGRAWKMAIYGDAKMRAEYYMILAYNRTLSDSEIQAIYNDPMNPPTSGLVLWLAPDSVDTANGVWTDKSGNGNDGTIVGASYVPLRPISEAQFSEARIIRNDGQDDYLVVRNFTMYGWQGMTIVEFLYIPREKNNNYWFKIDMIGDAWGSMPGTLLGGGPDYNYFNVIFRAVDSDGNVQYLAWTGLFYHKGEWVQVVRRYDNSSREYAVFFNGAKVYSATVNEGYKTVLDIPPTDSRFNRFVIGANIWYGEQLNVNHSLILIYSRALSDDEIKQIYENPENPPLDGLVLWYDPYSYDPSAGKWLNRAPIFPTIPLAEELDGVNYGAEPVRVSIPALHVYDIENNSEIPISNVSVAMLANNTTISLIPSLLTLPYNETVKLNVSATNYLPRILQFFTPVNTLDVYLQPKNQCESLNVEQAVNATELVKNITSYVNITPINSYAKAFIDSGGSFGDTIKLALKGDSLMRFILPQVLILAIVIVVLVQTTSPLAALGGALIGWAMSLGILGEAPSLRNSSMTFMLVVFLVAWTLWDLFYNYSRET